MSDRPQNARPSRSSRERHNPYPRPKASPPSPTMLPGSLGAEGTDELIRMNSTALGNPHLDLNNIPDIGRGISRSEWVATPAPSDSGTSKQRVDDVGIVSNSSAFAQHHSPQDNVGNGSNPPAFAQHHPAQYNAGPPNFHGPMRHIQSPYNQNGATVVTDPTSHSKWRKSYPKNNQPTRQPVIHEEDLRGTFSAMHIQGSAHQKVPLPRLQIITQGLPLPPGIPPPPPGTYSGYGPYGNPFVQSPQEVTMHNSIRAPPLPRFHNIPGTFHVGNAGRDPNHGYADIRHYMGSSAPAANFQHPGPIGYGGHLNPPYQMNNANNIGTLDVRRNQHGGRAEIDPRGIGANYYNPHSDKDLGRGLNAEFHEPLQRANPNPSMFISAIAQGGSGHMRGPQPPVIPYMNGGGIPYPPFSHSAIEYRAQNNTRLAPGTASSMKHADDPHRHLAPRESTPSVSGSHSTESRALVMRDDKSETSTGAMMSVGTSFRPSRMKLENDGLIGAPARHNTGSKYLGDPSSKSYNAQHLGLPDDQNCALWITKLHPDVDLPGFLNLVRTGAVFACTINEPERNLTTKAAKLVFKTHEGAADFLAQVDAGFEIEGQEIKAVWNRVGYRTKITDSTRCLYIRAASNFRVSGNLVMNETFWRAYFTQCVVYDLEGFREWHIDGTSGVEARFARIDGQAEALWHAIHKDPLFFGHVKVYYAPDPCDPHSGWQ